ncbi:hypothetical protein CN587_25340 [Bacillus wiedmannii]|uniref:hypothetical protein n=1 Tax=Bacillus wiedmannii TaxID=1890302 RepID=UPI000BF5B4DC|nr:hypothetical protein [Bacillus wiedmannii]PEQ01550.1 hypothetical protein CN587_25340 [Bacillus wiedmannii]HDX9654335.1 hypothetical protein [Bacillus wiedmannii]
MNITKDIDKIIVEGEELSFIEVKTSNWADGSVAGFIIKSNEKIKKFYDTLWSQEEVSLMVHYKDGSFHYKISKIVAVKDGTNGQYEYHLFGK